MRKVVVVLCLSLITACSTPTPPEDGGLDEAPPADLTVGRDAAVPPDLSTSPDATAPADLALLPDLTVPIDLTTPTDLTTLADLTTPADLSLPADLTPLPDLTSPADLIPLPDLTGPGAANGPVSFYAAPVGITIAGFIARMAAGDLDGDGRPEIVFGTGQLYVEPLNADGRPSMGLPPSIVDSYNARDFKLADLNGDGRLDLISARAPGSAPAGTQGVGVHIGNGDRTFRPVVAYGLGNGVIPEGVVVRDLDGDGRLDVVTANSAGSVASVLYGNGDGTLAAPVTLSLSSQTGTAPAVADFNGDGQQDVAVVYNSQNLANGRITFFFGGGNRTFQTGANGPVPGAGTTDIAAGDFNSDGRIDVAVANQGIFQTGGSYTGSGVAVLLNSGSGNFANPVSYSVDQDVRNVLALDLDGDGRLDLAASASGGNGGRGRVAILPGNGTGAFPTTLSYPVTEGSVELIAADADRDGRLDLFASGRNIYSGPDVLIGFLRNESTSGTVAMRGASSVTSGAGSGVTLAGDLNGDGRPDIVALGQGQSAAYIHLNQGGGQFAAAQSVTTGSNPVDGLLLDLNGDSRLDLLTANAGDHTLSLLLGNGSGGFAAATSLPTAASALPQGLAAGDINGDGRADVVVAESGANQISVYLQQAGGGLARQTAYAAGINPGSVAVLDLNRDGRGEVAALTLSEGVSLFRNDGQGNLTRGTSVTFNAPSPTSYLAGGHLRILRAADITRDGVPDLVVYQPVTNSYSFSPLRIWPGDGQGGVGTPVVINGGGLVASGLTIADVNGDGYPDVIGSSAIAAGVSVLTHQGMAGTLGTALSWSTNTGVLVPAVGDFDGDGRPDIVVASPNSSQLNILRNLGP